MAHVAEYLIAPRSRRAVQLFSIGFVAGAVALAAAYDVAVAAAILILGAIALIALKVSLVAHTATVQLRADLRAENERRSKLESGLRVASGQAVRLHEQTVRELRRLSDVLNVELGDVRKVTGELALTVDQLDARFLPDQEAALSLVRRADPLIAQLATVQNELLALRDEVERVDRRAARAARPGRA